MLSLLSLLLLTQSPSAFASCPPKCIPNLKAFDFKQKEFARINLILSKNEAYLVKYPQVSPSLLIKIRSNILMSKLQIETLQNQITVLTAENFSKGCRECLTPNPSTNGK